MPAEQTPDLRMFIPLTKIDIEKRLVYGIATAQKPDLAGEVCDYGTTKPLYEKWSDGVKKASGGKSLGNLRAMHGKVAAGKIVDMVFNDDAQQIEVCGKVVDDGEWKKVTEGVYTGFSQGGRYVKRWTDEKTGLAHYTAEPGEISLVDVPCLKEATFDVIKGEGLIEKHTFVSTLEDPDDDAIKAEAERLAKAAGDGRKWHDFADAACETLAKAARVAALAKIGAPEPEEEPGSPVEKNAPATEGGATPPAKADKKFDPEQFWNCGCADHKHVAKAEAVRCMKRREAEDEMAKVAAPAVSALDELEKKLGIEAPAEDEIEKAKKAEAGAAGAHRETAEAHTTAAELHEALAAHDDSTADETEQHLAAAAAHRRAAAAHTTAADAHDKKDEGAKDRSKKAATLTRHAADKSDGMFAEKCAADVTLTKYSPDEARDDNGRWTSSGSAAKHEAQSVTHALAATAFAMGVGEAGSRAGATIGEKLGRMAGKAIATAAAKGAPGAGAGGAAVGGKVGRVVGSIAGRMYGEARGWSFAGKADAPAGLFKDLHHIGRLAELIQSLFWLQEGLKGEAEREGDNSPIPGSLREQVAALAATLVDLAREETNELLGEKGAYGAEVLAMAAGMPEGYRQALKKVSADTPVDAVVADVLEKTKGGALLRTIDAFVAEAQSLVKDGVEGSTVGPDRLQKASDLLHGLGAVRSDADGANGDAVEKAQLENAALKKTIGDLETRVTGLIGRVDELSKRAAPAKAALRAVEKGDDIGDGPRADAGVVSADDLEKRLAAMEPDARARLLMKAALTHPVPAIR